MGHREELLDGAKKCLLERGYAHTTARDIVAVSGTNLASIGYHFGSKEALMTQAIIELIGEWGQQAAAAAPTEGGSYEERFAGHWRGLLETTDRDEQLAIASFENATAALRMPALLPIISAGQEDARVGFGAEFSPAGTAPETQRKVGALLLAVTSGVLVQRLIDREKAPSPADIVEAFRVIGKALDAGKQRA
jgi:AcrR family transcriptional regulator